MIRAAPRHRLRLLVVDDHRVFAEALAARLSANDLVEEVVVALTAADVAPKARAYRPDLALVDVVLGRDSGVDVVRALHEEAPDLPVVMVSGLDDVGRVVEALDAGARGWIPKDVTMEELLRAMDEVLLGHRWVAPSILPELVEALLHRVGPPAEPTSFVDQLTPRQRDVLDCLGRGLSRAETAAALAVSENTVRTHVQALLAKADAHSVLAVLAKARGAGYTFREDRGRPKMVRIS